MKTVTVRLPEALAAEIESESRRRRLSKSEVVRERLAAAGESSRPQPALLEAIADVIGSVDGLPRDLSARTKGYLKSTGYGVQAASLTPAFSSRSSAAATPSTVGRSRKRRACRRRG